MIAYLKKIFRQFVQLIQNIFFYDNIKHRMILEKNQVIHDIQNSFSRVTMKKINDNWNENDEHWAFTSYSDPSGIQFQAMNCAKCGDYIIINGDEKKNIGFSDKIYCNCHENEYEYDADDDSEYYREYAIERDYQFENERNTEYDLEYEYDYETECDLECYE